MCLLHTEVCECVVCICLVWGAGGREEVALQLSPSWGSCAGQACPCHWSDPSTLI